MGLPCKNVGPSRKGHRSWCLLSRSVVELDAIRSARNGRDKPLAFMQGYMTSRVRRSFARDAHVFYLSPTSNVIRSSTDCQSPLAVRQAGACVLVQVTARDGPVHVHPCPACFSRDFLRPLLLLIAPPLRPAACASSLSHVCAIPI